MTFQPSLAPSRPATRLLKWTAAAAAILCVAFFFRYVVIQPQSVGAICRADDAPAWCRAREILILFHAFVIWGYVALAAGIVALLTGWRWAIWLGLIMSLMGLVLYNGSYAAIGLVLILLTLPRA